VLNVAEKHGGEAAGDWGREMTILPVTIFASFHASEVIDFAVP
jgi:hypothetical protein